MLSHCLACSKLISRIDFYNTSMRANRLWSSFTSASPRVQDLVSLASLHLSKFAELDTSHKVQRLVLAKCTLSTKYLVILLDITACVKLQ